MPDLPPLLAEFIAGLWSAMQEPRLWFVFAVSVVGGVVRGYSGFGGALIVVPLAAMAMGPTVAVPMFYLFDLGSATPYGYKALPKCRWSQVWPHGHGRQRHHDQGAAEARIAPHHPAHH